MKKTLILFLLTLFVGTVSVYGQPNLVIKDITTTTPIYNNTPTDINITIANDGNASVDTTFAVQITITNASGVVYTDTQNVEDGLNANDSKNLTFTWTPNNTGEYNITAVVDPNDAVNESNEYDNTKTKTIEVLPTPNLVIKNITTTTPIYTNNPTEINITIANNGTGNVTTTFPVQITIKKDDASGNVVYNKTQNVNGLNAGDSTTLTFTWTPTNIGNYTIIAKVDPDNTVTESSDDDNTNTTTVTVLLAKPNLVIENITTTTPIYTNNPTEINITIANNGVADATDKFAVQITITDASGKEVYTNKTDVSGLNVNENKTLTFTWTPTNTGNYTITAVVDPDKAVDELNESDNNYTTTVTVLLAKPNLVIENITTTTPIYTNNPTEINITIANNGVADATTTFPVEITITDASGNTVYTETNVSGLNVGDSTTLTFYWIPGNTGEYTITAVVDPNNTVDELNESDNNYTTTVTVTVPTIALKKGWNLLSIPHRADITFSNPEAVVSIITYYNNTWYSESNLEPLYGYYIYCNNDTIMTIKYIIPEEPTAPPARPVFKGWNLVGVNPAEYDIDGVRLMDFVLPVEDSWVMILDPENNALYTKYDNISSIVLHPYDAYWMYCKENDILAGRSLY
ncbi:CARDB domain-containing protein [Methanofervidicoccus abyssi]|uniref:CARDB domain-containing protein n=1 Tax=Methanofervidicoccus abyssi TaxID=2082189 RepID=A0A401HQV2_9EURY|nr:CARDB domain-containing protein [Methanofervidicoccus abyssi]GBF36647.1 hypothetical protein MHHB_P0877 [Methanofervidicoccus abyssi]